MRPINTNNYSVLLQGKEWEHEMSPCSKEASKLLENNESVVTWLGPSSADGRQMPMSHVPAILYKGQYWTLSLRMSKCIYRHIRLRRGFKNIQRVHGVRTLRIPQLLFKEKKRTQTRFEVC